jgi:predicted ester cyclase
MTRDEAVALVRQLQDAANCHDVSRLLDFYADDAVAVSPVFAEVRGRPAIRSTWETLFKTFPDCALDVSNVLVDGSRIAMLGTVTATDRTGWFGLPPTGGPISYRVVVLCTIVGGKIVHEERIYDSTGVVERLEKAHLDKELRTAADIQRALLSRTVHAGRRCEAVGDSVPCRAIGGDFFEFVELPSGDFGVALGDVAGKGPAAALLAALLQGMLIADVQAAQSPALMLSRMNRRLAARHLESRFATLVYGVLSEDGRFVYANAGHNPPVLLTRDGIRRLTAGGPILGAFADVEYADETLHFNDQETLIAFTDGVTEARNAQDEEFGDDRLIACAREHATCPPVALLDRIFGAVREFGERTDQTDDITVAVLRFG